MGLRPLGAIGAILTRSRSGRRDDGRKLALVLEGGGMRGAYTGGGVVALERLGLTSAFDEVYATSAGAMNAAYFLAHQASQGIVLYPDYLARTRFYNPLRVWKSIDIDYVFDRLITREVPLDLAAVAASPSKLFVAVMDRATGEGKLLCAGGDAEILRSILKAATAIPVLYNRTVRVHDRDYIDGGLVTPFPLLDAVANGCTDILLLLSSDEAHDREPPPRWARMIFNVLCARGSAPLNAAFAGYAQTRSRCMEAALGKVALRSGVNIATVTSGGLVRLHRTSTQRAILLRASAEYEQRVLDLFRARERDD
jgi:predicted patatin/cPLA2 family phospholipase